MSDTLLLRFRDLHAGIESVDAHNTIATQFGSVYWGWWKKPLEAMPDPGLSVLARELEGRNGRVLLINSANRKLYEAPLFKIHYQPGGPSTAVPNREKCPNYYEEENLPAWFEIGLITEVVSGYSYLDSFVLSTSNRTAPNRTITALSQDLIGQVITDHDFLDSNLSLWLITHTDDVGIIGRSSIVRSTSRGVWPTKGRYILHLSDLHFGAHHAFRNQLTTSTGALVGKESLLEALLGDLEALNISDREIGAIFATGDLTWTSDAHEFANAQSFFLGLTNRLGIHPSAIVVIPGNHDIEWRSGKGDVDPNAELNYSNFCSSFYNCAPSRSFFRAHRLSFGGRTVCVLGFNSCRLESKDNAGLGFVGREQLKEAAKFLEGIDATTELRLALIHHHLLPVNYIEAIDWESKRLSITLDSDAVLRCLIHLGVRVVFHGHQHQPYYSEIRRIVEGFVSPHGACNSQLDGKVAVVGGGSIGVERGHLNVVGRNSYNIIDLGDDQRIQIQTRTSSPVGPGFSEYQKVIFDLAR